MWGQWLHDGSGHRLGYPTSSNFVIKVGLGTPLYDEQVAELIELCMCELKRRHPDLYWPLYYCYYWNVPAFEAAEKLKLTKSVYKIKKQKGEVWMDAIYFSEKYKKSA